MNALLRHALAALRAAPGRALLVGLGLALSLGLPALVLLGVQDLARAVRARAEAVPLVVGAPGGEADLVLGSLYWRGRPARELDLSSRVELLARPDVEVLPLVLGASAQGRPVVGVDAAWFDGRGPALARGRRPGVLGEVVVGAALARELALAPGEELVSDPPERADFVGPTSVVLDVVGVLAETGGPDDGAVFCDLSTAWLLRGELHGHAEVQASEALPGEPGQGAGSGGGAGGTQGTEGTGGEPAVTEASAAVFLYERLSPEARRQVHGHGQRDALPVSALLLFPADQRAHDQVLAELVLDPERQVVRPVEVVDRVLGVVVAVQEGIVGMLVLVGLGCLGLLGVVLRLDWRLRAEERALVAALGGPRWWVPAQLALELLLVGAAATGAAWGLVVLGRRVILGLLVGV